ncbi:MAG: deoxyribose-phosphate aldolase [Victivallales bacterium]
MPDIKKLDRKSLAKMMDFSILPKETRKQDILDGCRVAKEYGFAAFYSSSPFWTPIVAKELAGTDIEIGTGIAFPFGSVPPSVKAFETEEAIKRGCTTVDIVMNVGALKDGDYKTVKEELDLFAKAAGNTVTKAILEVCYLTKDEIATGSKMIAEAGIKFAKTSTGQFEGPSLEQFLVMKEALKGTNVRLKVSGVKFPRPQNALIFIMAGAERIGTRAAPEIVDGLAAMRSIGLC